ncbi:hypothetical protein ACH4OW_31765 [Streptomyces sp. NPDC017056]|uniref:hypothetical protein n=1 Tax=Streptomyces sp. NPDC017056 TaxID=3364973 RepID=UPI0037B1ACDA
MTTQTQPSKDGAEAVVPTEAPEPTKPGVIRLCDPAEDRARVGRHRTGGSNAVGRRRADVRLLVDINEPDSDGTCQVTGRVRGTAHHRDSESGDAPWKHTGTYRAQDWLSLLRRGINDHFTIVVEERENFRDDPGLQPDVLVTLFAKVNADRLSAYTF